MDIHGLKVLESDITAVVFRYFPAKREKGEKWELCSCDNSEYEATAEWSQPGDLVITPSLVPSVRIMQCNKFCIDLAVKNKACPVEDSEDPGNVGGPYQKCAVVPVKNETFLHTACSAGL